MATTYEVTGPLALVTDAAGKVRYYYKGAVLPGDVPAEQLERLGGRGLITKVTPAVVTEPGAPPTGTDPAGGTDPPTGTESAEEASPVTTAPVKVERPAQVATKAAWVEYAVSPPHRMDRAKAEAMTKAELIDALSPQG